MSIFKTRWFALFDISRQKYIHKGHSRKVVIAKTILKFFSLVTGSKNGITMQNFIQSNKLVIERINKIHVFKT